MLQKGSRHPLVAAGAPSEAGPISNRCQGESWRERGADGMGWGSPGRTEASAGVEVREERGNFIWRIVKQKQ